MPLTLPTAPLLKTNQALWQLLGANMNSTADQAFVKNFTFTSFLIESILITNVSTSLTLAAGGIYDGASKGGTAIVAAAQVYSALTGATKVLAATLGNTDMHSGANLFLSLTTGQGGAATADFYVFGWALS